MDEEAAEVARAPDAKPDAVRAALMLAAVEVAEVEVEPATAEEPATAVVANVPAVLAALRVDAA